jgi:hypothetical protein
MNLVDSHRYSFFGKRTGIILNSASRNDPFIMLTCIREKADQSWEKPSQNEGKIVRISLEEMIEIMRVLNQETQAWNTIHKYKDETTKISFKWKDNSHSALLIDIGNYPKLLGYSQSELFRLLLRHLIKEKIVYATTPMKQTDDARQPDPERKTSRSKVRPRVVEEVKPEVLDDPEEESVPIKEEVIQKDKDVEAMLVKGSFMAETEKAVLIGLEPDKSVWFPKSTVRSPYEKEKFQIQQFMIDTWILKKNQVVS